MKTCKKLLAITIALVLLVSTLVSGLVVSAADANTLVIGTTEIVKGTATADVQFVLTFAEATKAPHSLCTITAAEGLTLSELKIDAVDYVSIGDTPVEDDELIDADAEVTINNDGKNIAAGKVLFESAVDSKAPTVNSITFTATFAVAADAAVGDYAVNAEIDATNYDEADYTIAVTAGKVSVVEPPVVEPECDHEWVVVEATPATAETAGSIILDCTKCDEADGTVKDVLFHDRYEAFSANLSLAAEITLNYYVRDSRIDDQGTADDAFFKTTIIGDGFEDVKYTTMLEAADETVNARPCQAIPVGIGSKFMTDPVSLDVFVNYDGQWYSGNNARYSLVDVAHLRDSQADNAEKALYANLLTYGGKAQNYFDYKLDNLADSAENLGIFADFVNTETPVVTNDVVMEHTDPCIRSNQFNFTLADRVTLNIVFRTDKMGITVDPADVAATVSYGADGSLGSKTITEFEDVAGYVGKRYTLGFSELTSRQWREPISVKYSYNGEVTNSTFTTSYAGLVAYSIDNKLATGELADLYYAMVNYGDASYTYFG